jgi:hypothetical protein
MPILFSGQTSDQQHRLSPAGTPLRHHRKDSGLAIGIGIGPTIDPAG